MEVRRKVVAIDFETANTARNSACAIAVLPIIDGHIGQTYFSLLKPYSPAPFMFSRLHGITAFDVANAPHLHEVWPTNISPIWDDADLIVAHNMSFDMGVLRACGESGNFAPVPRPYACTVQMARRAWPRFPNHKLDTLCSQLSIPLNHHDAVSDVQACANIFLRAYKIDQDYLISEMPGYVRPKRKRAYKRKPDMLSTAAPIAMPQQAQQEKSKSFWRRFFGL